MTYLELLKSGRATEEQMTRLASILYPWDPEGIRALGYVPVGEAVRDEG